MVLTGRAAVYRDELLNLPPEDRVAFLLRTGASEEHATEAARQVEALEAALLTPQERHTLHERIRSGRSHQSIARDAVMVRPDGKPYTRQRVYLFEANARRKLGLPGSVAETVHALERATRSVRLAARGRRTRPDDLCNDDASRVKPRKLTSEEKKQRLLERWADQLLAS